MLAILKSGAAYLPLDVNQPQARLQQIIDDAQPVILITESINLTANKQLSITQLAQTQAHFKAVNIQLNQLAYVLYTSGSTGKPKGVLVEHQQLIHYNQSVSNQLFLPPNGHYGLISTLAADLGNTMLFPAWLTASCVHLLSDDLATDGYALSQYCQSSPLDCLKIVPSHLEALLCGGIKGDGNAALLPTDVLILGGEPISPSLIELLKALAPTCTIYNHYGPTETTVGVMFAMVDLNNNNTRLTTTIGDNQVYLLDEQLKPVINGQQGQLYVAGSSVSRGYLNDVNRTNLVYLDNPFSAGKMYHTGDLAVRHADFSIDIIGRSDQQVKIRGFRLELDEIVSQLMAHPQVSQANMQIEGQGETAKLIAFVVATKGAVLSESALLAHLATQLPHYMVPTQLHQLVQLPLNANGKIDRKQLLNWAAQQEQQTHEPAKNTIEKQLLNIWQAVLQQQNIGVTDDFFTIGGHSLAAIKIVAKIRQQMNVSLPNNFLFHHRTIRRMAKHLVTESSLTRRLINLTPSDSEHTMVLMHSHAGHFNYHQQFIANLAQDISLFGLTPNEKLWQLGTISEVIEDYAAQLKPLKSKPLLLAGWSLGAKLMVLLAKRLAELEFDITAVAVIDFDLGQKLNTTDTAKQLIGDFEDYLATQSLSFDIDAIKDSLSGSYQQAMTQLLNHSKIKSIIGEDISNASLVQQFMMRWHIKQKLYQTQLSPVNLPLWVWRGNSHHYGAQIWQPYTNQPIESHFIDADHYAILDTELLAKQLIHNIQSQQSVEQQP
jgi:amino acid adenylation domain-containing protein